MNALYLALMERRLKGAIAAFLLILCLSLVIAVCQSIRFSSSLWVIANFGFVEWQEHITRMLRTLVPWAVLTGVLFTSDTLALTIAMAPRPANALPRAAVSFGMGFIYTYLFVVVLGILFYMPLGMLSFVFPDSIQFLCLGFAFLCSTYVVFLLIAIETPSLLVGMIKKAPLYFRLLGLLFAALLVTQTLSTALSILKILLEHSIWRVQLPAFIIAFGATMVVTALVNLLIIKEGTPAQKVLRAVGAFVLSIVTANVSEGILHWGEYAAAIVAAFGPVAYSFLIRVFQKNITTASSGSLGLLGGLGTGLLMASIIGLRIVGQGWFGVACGSMIALALGISFGMTFGPRVVEFLARAIGVRPIVALYAGVGYVVGVMIGVLVGGFVGR